MCKPKKSGKPLIGSLESAKTEVYYTMKYGKQYKLGLYLFFCWLFRLEKMKKTINKAD